MTFPNPEDDIFASMKEQLSDIEIPKEESPVDKLSLKEIYAEVEKIRQKLLKNKEMFTPISEESRQLHSRRAALLIEINRRFAS